MMPRKLLQKRNKEFSPLLDDANYDVAKAMFGIIQSGERLNVDYENITTYETDFVPVFKYRKISPLEIYLHKLKPNVLLAIGIELHELGKKHGLFDYSNRKWKKSSYSTVDYILLMLQRINKRYFKNCWFCFDDSVDFPDVRIEVLKFLNEEDVGSRWKCDWMIDMQHKAHNTYLFFLKFFNRLNEAGIGFWFDDFNDMLFDFFVEQSLEQPYDSSDTDEIQQKEKMQLEVLSYKKGMPNALKSDILKMNTKMTMMQAFHLWRKNDDSNCEQSIVNEIQRFCELLDSGICIYDYEKHYTSSYDDLPCSNSLRFHMAYDYGEVENDAQSYGQSQMEFNGFMELADSIVLTKENKSTFYHKGRLLEELLFLWNNTEVFNYYNEKFETYPAVIDGARICDSALRTTESTE